MIAATKQRAKLIIEPIFKGQSDVAEKLKTKSGYATVGQIIDRYQETLKIDRQQSETTSARCVC